MHYRKQNAVRTAIALSLGLALAACGDVPNNSSLYSVRQPVVERSNFTLDVAASAGGLPITEKRRLAEWFETLDLGYGDRVSIDAAMPSDGVRDDVIALVGRYGLLLSDGAPLTQGHVAPGAIRVVVTRSKAHVPGCTDWSDQFAANPDSATHDNFGCAINSNLAAMVADPEHLLRGATGTGETVVMSSTKAIEAYRETPPTGTKGLPAVSSQSAGGN